MGGIASIFLELLLDTYGTEGVHTSIVRKEDLEPLVFVRYQRRSCSWVEEGMPHSERLISTKWGTVVNGVMDGSCPLDWVF
jgi:hypothetical protein